MSRGVNKVILVGRLGGDPEIRETVKGSRVANFSVATSESWKDRQSGDKQERTEWHNVTVFGRLVDVVEQWLGKGQLVYLEGKLSTSEYEDRNGQRQRRTKVVAFVLEMLGGGGNREGDKGSGVSEGSGVSPGRTDDFFDDDEIPF